MHMIRSRDLCVPSVKARMAALMCAEMAFGCRVVLQTRKNIVCHVVIADACVNRAFSARYLQPPRDLRLLFLLVIVWLFVWKAGSRLTDGMQTDDWVREHHFYCEWALIALRDGCTSSVDIIMFFALGD